MKRTIWDWVVLAGLMGAQWAWGQVDARMLRQPDVSKTHITFVYAGDIWVVPKEGGTAQRLSSPAGEESFPKFSPDGSSIAFSGNYDGNQDIYTIPAQGGMVKRITHHPMPDRLLGWHPDGNFLLYASGMESGRDRFNQLYKISREGGMPEKLPVPYGEFGSISPDGKILAYMPQSQDFRTWKRYRGGWVSRIWLFDLDKKSYRSISTTSANDGHPMWHDQTLYFMSDRGVEQRNNIWAYDLKSGKARQITHFTDYDLHFPAIGPSDIVFEAGGKLYLLPLSKSEPREIKIKVTTDEATLKPRVEKVSRYLQNASLSPAAKRVIFEGRGDLFSVPAEHGPILNLTHSSGVAERFPAWSPDGKTVAAWSDRSGEYELTLRPADGSGSEEVVTQLGPGFRYQPYWSPDSKKLAFIDQAMKIYLFESDSKKLTCIDKGTAMTHGALNDFHVSWSADSRWMAFSRDLRTRSNAIFIYDTQKGALHQVTSGYFSSADPAFDPEGKYLYFTSSRSLQPSYSNFDNSWIYANSTNILAVPLRLDVASPLAQRNDEEVAKDEKPGKDKSGPEKEAAKAEDKKGGAIANGDKPATGKDEKKEEKKVTPVEIDLDNFESRAVILPVPAGNYDGLRAAEGKVVFLRRPRTGAPSNLKSQLAFFDLKEREEQSVLEEIDDYELSSDGKKLLVRQAASFAILEVKPKQKIEKKLRVDELEMQVDPKAEWRQIFNDAWRLERDYFYDPNMHGVDWKAMREHYGKLLDNAVTRWDVNFVLGELIAELNASHTYRGGGDLPAETQRGVGLLGVDWALENGAFRIKRILHGGAWDVQLRSPLAEPGLKVKEGDYILEVNGVSLDPRVDPWTAFPGLADQTIQLTVNDKPSLDGSRKILVRTLANEDALRQLDWIESNRQYVEKATGGRLGYIYVPSTGIDGQTELLRQFQGQYTKEGLIIDERFNSGGQIPDRFVELLNRPPLSFWATRDGKDWQWPPVANFGPKVMLINGWSGSGGDCFPYYFKKAGIGPLIGTRTWGGLIGISGNPPLVDGGNITVPTFRMYGTEGKWFAEGHGVEPDIEVVDDPGIMATGKDPQLERAIQEVEGLIKTKPPVPPKRPTYEDRANHTAEKGH
jgi:tricorn protease